jgi:hypothetical protein
MKNGLGNLAATAADQLTAIIKNRLKSIQYRPGLIDAFLAETGLSLEPEPRETSAFPPLVTDAASRLPAASRRACTGVRSRHKQPAHSPNASLTS